MTRRLSQVGTLLRGLGLGDERVLLAKHGVSNWLVNVRRHVRELLVGRGEVCLSLVELRKRDVEVDVVVDADVADPVAKASRVVDADVDDPVAQASRRGRLACLVREVDGVAGVAVAAGVARGQPHRVLPLGVGDGASVRAHHRLGFLVNEVICSLGFLVNSETGHSDGREGEAGREGHK